VTPPVETQPVDIVAILHRWERIDYMDEGDLRRYAAVDIADLLNLLEVTQERLDTVEAAASRVVDNSYSINSQHTFDSMRRACTPTCVACGLEALRDLLGGYSWRRGVKKDAS
jgi:hypothetical protein